MPNLKEINEIHRTDKGFGHNYIDFYETVFNPLKNEPLNILEIGVLFGNSLKLWNDYFINSHIFGVDNFSQPDGHLYYNYKPVIADEVKEALKSYNRIKLLIFDCVDKEKINENLNNLKFDIIIDDANHDLNQQKQNYLNYHPFLTEKGIFICEDITSVEAARSLGNFIHEISPDKKIHIHQFNIKEREDDRILIVFPK